MTVIRTARLTLRPFVEGDIDAMVALLNDWEVSQWLAVPPYPYRRADARFNASMQISSSIRLSLAGKLVDCTTG